MKRGRVKGLLRVVEISLEYRRVERGRGGSPVQRQYCVKGAYHGVLTSSKGGGGRIVSTPTS